LRSYRTLCNYCINYERRTCEHSIKHDLPKGKGTHVYTVRHCDDFAPDTNTVIITRTDQGQAHKFRISQWGAFNTEPIVHFLTLQGITAVEAINTINRNSIAPRKFILRGISEGTGG
jgi:hypothetical protein